MFGTANLANSQIMSSFHSGYSQNSETLFRANLNLCVGLPVGGYKKNTTFTPELDYGNKALVLGATLKFFGNITEESNSFYLTLESGLLFNNSKIKTTERLQSEGYDAVLPKYFNVPILLGFEKGFFNEVVSVYAGIGPNIFIKTKEGKVDALTNYKTTCNFMVNVGVRAFVDVSCYLFVSPIKEVDKISGNRHKVSGGVVMLRIPLTVFKEEEYTL